MEFCEKCGALMRPKRVDGKIVLVCSSCGFVKEPSNSTMKITEKRERDVKSEIAVVDSEVAAKTMPKVKAVCPRCGNNEAYWWMVQTRRGDEAPTRFYRCTKCNYTWREYE
ncbi:MAG: transcription factor S [archaeon YNP-LCB-003-016]|jgi:DNA-directed RNA polymerase subunit M|uniref:transcription factor S n=1 Tax=Candidatus Culexarchaeum yellowstonense TaxID=2928963 RepID=UPI0026EECC33|nr:transcription factor S [Candidatus Culexarchaeum yellowstonense]MCR6692171.1 transcription factor S [Candidatus Culexarchaeum yellowstonense]